MALIQTELLEVAPPVIYQGATVGDRYCCAVDYRFNGSGAPGNVPRGTVAVLDTNTETAKGYKGLGYFNRAAASGSYLWIVSHAGLTNSARELIRLTPSSGANTGFTVSGLTKDSTIVFAGTEIWVINRSGLTTTNLPVERFDIASSTWLTPYTNPSPKYMGMSYTGAAQWDGGSYVYFFGDSKVHRVSISTGTATDVTPSGYSGQPFGDRQVLWHSGSFWNAAASVVYKYTPASSTWTTFSASFGAAVFPSLQVGPDGFLYGVAVGTDTLCIVDPATGSTGTEALSPSRAARGFLGVANGKLWVAAGAPYTR